MLVLPVVDLKSGVAVHGRAGERHHYRPVQSVLCATPDPLDLAVGVRHHLGLTELYVADLDAIAGQEIAWTIHESLSDLGFRLWIDAGIVNRDQAMDVDRHLGDAADIVLGLETLEDIEAIGSCLGRFGAEKIVVSLDMDDGRPRTRVAKWQYADSLAIVHELCRIGVKRLILLDIRRVGMGQGTGTDELLQSVRSIDANLQLTCGGGVRHLNELTHLAQIGCDSVLMATALHEGRIGRSQIARLRASSS